MSNQSTSYEGAKGLRFHFIHKWLPWEVVGLGEHVHTKRTCIICNYTVKRVKVGQTR